MQNHYTVFLSAVLPQSWPTALTPSAWSSVRESSRWAVRRSSCRFGTRRDKSASGPWPAPITAEPQERSWSTTSPGMLTCLFCVNVSKNSTELVRLGDEVELKQKLLENGAPVPTPEQTRGQFYSRCPTVKSKLLDGISRLPDKHHPTWGMCATLHPRCPQSPRARVKPQGVVRW